MYDVNSKHADDFINHEEILDTLAYADLNKDNLTLVESIIKKAENRKGLTHREASVLLACDSPELNEIIFRLAEQIKKISTETALFSLRRYTFPTTASTAALTARTMRQISISRESSYPRRTYAGRLLLCRTWGISGWL